MEDSNRFLFVTILKHAKKEAKKGEEKLGKGGAEGYLCAFHEVPLAS